MSHLTFIGGTRRLGPIEWPVDLPVAVDVVRRGIAGLHREGLARPHELHVWVVHTALLVQRGVALGRWKTPALETRLDPDKDVSERSVVIDYDGLRLRSLAAVKLCALRVCARHVDGPHGRWLSRELHGARDGRSAQRGVPRLAVLSAGLRDRKSVVEGKSEDLG